MDHSAEETLSSLAHLTGVAELSMHEFAGIGALAERIGRRGISQRDDLEVADFDLLQQKINYLEMSPNLRELFFFICKEEEWIIQFDGITSVFRYSPNTTHKVIMMSTVR